MKRKIYECMVDIWHLACKYEFLGLDDKTWEAFIADGRKLLVKYKGYGKLTETMYRELFAAVQNFYIGLSSRQ